MVLPRYGAVNTFGLTVADGDKITCVDAEKIFIDMVLRIRDTCLEQEQTPTRLNCLEL